MKCAILMSGLSFVNEKYCVDFRKSYDNYQEYIFQYLKNMGYDIDVYICTNTFLDKDEDIKKELIEKYKPVKSIYLENTYKSRVHIAKNKKLLSVIETCLENGTEYDIVVITRFDLMFKINFEKSNIDLNKFNFVSLLEKDHLVCDNLYILPYTYLDDLMEIVKNKIKKSNHKNEFGCSMHTIRHALENRIGKENINYILSQKRSVCDLSFYKIVRNLNR